VSLASWSQWCCLEASDELVAAFVFELDCELPVVAAIAAPAPARARVAAAEASRTLRLGLIKRDLLSLGYRSIEPAAAKKRRRFA
jgi:hypothetical protein